MVGRQVGWSAQEQSGCGQADAPPLQPTGDVSG